MGVFSARNFKLNIGGAFLCKSLMSNRGAFLGKN